MIKFKLIMTGLLLMSFTAGCSGQLGKEDVNAMGKLIVMGIPMGTSKNGSMRMVSLPCIDTDDALYILDVSKKTKLVGISVRNDNVSYNLGRQHHVRGRSYDPKSDYTIGSTPNIFVKVSYLEDLEKEK